MNGGSIFAENAIVADRVDKRITFEEAYDEYAIELFGIGSLDLVTLRAHALVELALKDLLAIRLGVESSAIPDLTFARLTELALAGMPKALTDVVLHFNRLRNYVAHHIHAHGLDAKIDEFFRERKELRIEWSRIRGTKRKLFVWAAAVGLIATVLGCMPRMLSQFRKAQNDLAIQALTYDEPRFFAEIGDTAVEQLDLAVWLKEESGHLKRKANK